MIGSSGFHNTSHNLTASGYYAIATEAAQGLILESPTSDLTIVVLLIQNCLRKSYSPISHTTSNIEVPFGIFVKPDQQPRYEINT